MTQGFTTPQPSPRATVRGSRPTMIRPRALNRRGLFATGELHGERAQHALVAQPATRGAELGIEVVQQPSHPRLQSA